jgi:hypothetical protein
MNTDHLLHNRCCDSQEIANLFLRSIVLLQAEALVI